MRDIVSVVIPAHNYASYLGGAIESALHQGYQPVEVIVVDDGSTDGTPAVLERFAREVLAVHLDGRGVAEARNAGLARAAGAYVVFLDADDLLLPGGLQAQVNRFAQEPAADAVYGEWFACDVRTGISFLGKSPIPADAVIPRILLGNVVTTPSAMMIRRGALEEAGGFNPAVSFTADWDMWIRLGLRGHRFGAVTEPVAIYRIHGASMTQDLASAARDIWYVLDRYFDDPALPPQAQALRDKAYANMSLYLGKLHLEQGDEDGARTHLRRVMELDRDAADAARFYYEIARAIWKRWLLEGARHRSEAAEGMFAFVSALASSRPPVSKRREAAMHLGVALAARRLGDQQYALGQLRLSVRSSWRTVVARRHLSFALRVCTPQRLAAAVRGGLAHLSIGAGATRPVPPLVALVMAARESRATPFLG